MFNDKKWKKYFIPLLVTGISAFALFLRLDKLAHHTLWNDELNQLKTMKGNFFDLVRDLPHNELNTYLNLDHFLTYPFFKIFSYNKWGLAIPHIIITIVGFYLLYLICRRYFKTVWGYIISFVVVCFNATLIFHATEIRGYAVLPTLALATFYFSQVLVDEINTMSARKKFFISAFFVFVMWFHAYGIFILSICTLFSLMGKVYTRTFDDVFKGIVKFMLVIFCVGIPVWLCCMFSPVRFEQPPGKPFAYIPNPLIDLLGFLKGVFGNLVGAKSLYFLLAGVVFPFIFPLKDRIKQIMFVMIMVFLPLLLIFVSDLIVHYWFIQRQFIWVIPYFAIYLGWSFDSFISYVSGLSRSLGKEKK